MDNLLSEIDNAELPQIYSRLEQLSLLSSISKNCYVSFLNDEIEIHPNQIKAANEKLIFSKNMKTFSDFLNSLKN